MDPLTHTYTINLISLCYLKLKSLSTHLNALKNKGNYFKKDKDNKVDKRQINSVAGDAMQENQYRMHC